jgi:hypothetical protein
MGIYTNGIIYGIRISRFVEDQSSILFEIKDDVMMSREKINEVKFFYKRLVNKNNLLFTNYIECSNTYGEGVYETWSIISLDVFLEIIGV